MQAETSDKQHSQPPSPGPDQPGTLASDAHYHAAILQIAQEANRYDTTQWLAQPQTTTRRSGRKRTKAQLEEDRAADELGDEDGADDSDEYVPEKRRREDGDEEGGGSQETQPETDPLAHQFGHIPDLGHPYPSMNSTQSMGSESQTLPAGSFIIDPHTGMPVPAPQLDENGVEIGFMRKRGRKQPNDEEWNRQRKDNHKEVERRRRGNINEGINQLAAIVPNSTGGEKAKGAILTRAVQYIHTLKDNEARNIEKWTLEKLLMDQAMHDLQGQLEDLQRRYEIERQSRINSERELEMLRARDESGSKRRE